MPIPTDFHIDLVLGAKLSTLDHILYLWYTYMPSKRNYFTKWRWVSYHCKMQVNGPHQCLSLAKKLQSPLGSKGNSIHYLSYGIFYDDVKDKNDLLRMTSQCNIIPLNLMISQRTYAPLQYPLVNSNTIDYLWVLNAPLIMLRESWKISSMM